MERSCSHSANAVAYCIATLTWVNHPWWWGNRYNSPAFDSTKPFTQEPTITGHICDALYKNDATESTAIYRSDVCRYKKERKLEYIAKLLIIGMVYDLIRHP